MNDVLMYVAGVATGIGLVVMGVIVATFVAAYKRVKRGKK